MAGLIGRVPDTRHLHVITRHIDPMIQSPRARAEDGAGGSGFGNEIYPAADCDLDGVVGDPVNGSPCLSSPGRILDRAAADADAGDCRKCFGSHVSSVWRAKEPVFDLWFSF